jgi:hypothetical protein
MSDEPVKKCPECEMEVRRLISGGVGVIFKGSGFYVNDKDRAGTKPGTESKTSETAPEASGPATAACNTCPAKGDSCAGQNQASAADNSKTNSTGDGTSAKSKTKPAA